MDKQVKNCFRSNKRKYLEDQKVAAEKAVREDINRKPCDTEKLTQKIWRIRDITMDNSGKPTNEIQGQKDR